MEKEILLQYSLGIDVIENYYISTVIYPSLKGYTPFERAYNKLSKKRILSSDCS